MLISIRIVHVGDDFKPLNSAAKERKERKDKFDSLRSLRSLAANSVPLRHEPRCEMFGLNGASAGWRWKAELIGDGTGSLPAVASGEGWVSPVFLKNSQAWICFRVSALSRFRDRPCLPGGSRKRGRAEARKKHGLDAYATSDDLQSADALAAKCSAVLIWTELT